MYNYQTYRKEQEVSRRCQDIRRQNYRAVLNRQKVNPALAHSHKKRVQGFILSMLDKPIKVQQYQNHPLAFRSYDSSKNLSINGFYLRHENEAQRIEESLRKNSELDHIPFSNTFSHQFRQEDGECKPMKYKAINHNFRIKEHLDRQCLNYLPNSSGKQVDLSLKKALAKQNTNLQSLNKTVNKSLLPMLHNKTYFKSVATLYSALPALPNQLIKSEYKQIATHSDNCNEDESQLKKETTKTNDHMNRSQNSRQALIKCNMLRLQGRSGSSLGKEGNNFQIRA